MKRDAKKQAGAKRRAAKKRSRALKWIVALATVALIGYGISQMSNVAYGERQLSMIDFSDLSEEQKHAALEEANEARCPCGCGMTLAQCVATDPNCPMRTDHISLIRGMVARARAS
jgi:hypothetical protein